MNSLPSSIEAYLQEAGFSATEIVILKRLLEEDALTLRQIASKTGKSTGVLDQAMKKLLQKDIVSKEWFNGTFKFTLVSLQSIVRWMEKDARDKRESLQRRHQNFEAFIATLQLDKKRPEMQYYNGREGLEQAYMRLLGQGKEMLWYVPVLWTAEEDPMRDFRVQYFRERRRQGIFSRIIAHDTPLGRRYQSRDPFEFRQTMLVPENQYPFTFEKAIVGDTITCFNLEENCACYIHYPEMASMERAIFEGIWNRDKHLPAVSSAPVPEHHSPASPEPVIPLKTKTLSRLREFFLSKESLVSFAIFGIAAAAITFALQQYTSELHFQRTQETVKSIAATSALLFDINDLDALQKKDSARSERAKIVSQLNQIRANNKNITSAYILKKSPTDSQKVEFVTDSGSLSSIANSDHNPALPIDTLLAFNSPTASKKIQNNEGIFVTGYAPIRDSHNQSVAILAVDMRVDKQQKLYTATFTPFIWFIIIFFALVVLRLAAFNRSLLKETWQVFQMRRLLTVLTLCAEISFFVTLGLYYYTMELTKKELGTRLMSIASTASSEFDTRDLDQLRFAKDMKTEAYQKVFKKLNEIRAKNTDIKFAYIQRLIEPPYLWEFVADADSNYNVPFMYEDYNDDGVLDKADENVAPGIRHFEKPREMYTDHPSYSAFASSQWGILLSGYAPVGLQNYVLGVDIDVSQVQHAVNEKFAPWLWFFGFFAVSLLLILVSRSITRK